MLYSKRSINRNFFVFVTKKRIVETSKNMNDFFVIKHLVCVLILPCNTEGLICGPLCRFPLKPGKMLRDIIRISSVFLQEAYQCKENTIIRLGRITAYGTT